MTRTYGRARAGPAPHQRRLGCCGLPWALYTRRVGKQDRHRNLPVSNLGRRLFPPNPGPPLRGKPREQFASSMTGYAVKDEEEFILVVRRLIPAIGVRTIQVVELAKEH